MTKQTLTGLSTEMMRLSSDTIMRYPGGLGFWLLGLVWCILVLVGVIGPSGKMESCDLDLEWVEIRQVALGLGRSLHTVDGWVRKGRGGVKLRSRREGSRRYGRTLVDGGSQVDGQSSSEAGDV